MKHNLNFKSTRKDVNYSNTFIFKSRCKICGTAAGKTVFRRPVPYEYRSAQEFHKTFMGYVPTDMIIRNNVKTYPAGAQTPYCISNLNVNHFKNNKNKYEKEDWYTRLVSCECGMTWWHYKNTTIKHSSKFIKIK